MPQDSVLSPRVAVVVHLWQRRVRLGLGYYSFNDLNLIQCPIHSYGNASALHFSMSFSRRPSQKQINDSRGDATECLTSGLSLISDWGREDIVLFNASKTQFLHLSTQQILPDNYSFYFDDTQLSPISTLQHSWPILHQNS